jgi:hypothetical protein
MTCGLCHKASIEFFVYKNRLIVCPDCKRWIEYEEAINPEEEA